MIFAAYDVRVPPTDLVGAFLKNGKLALAEACSADQCTQPIIQISKTFTFDDIEWQDEFADPGSTNTILTMDQIGQRVPNHRVR